MTDHLVPENPVPPVSPVLAWLAGGHDAALVVLFGWLGFLTATAEAFLVPLRWPFLFTGRMPVSLLGALVVTPLLVWGCYRLTGRAGGAMIPAALWFAGAVLWSWPSREGDVILAANNGVSLPFMLGGAVVATIAVCWVMQRGLKDRQRAGRPTG